MVDPCEPCQMGANVLGSAKRLESGHMPVLKIEGDFHHCLIEVDFRFREEDGRWGGCRISQDIANCYHAPTLSPPGQTNLMMLDLEDLSWNKTLGNQDSLLRLIANLRSLSPILGTRFDSKSSAIPLALPATVRKRLAASLHSASRRTRSLWG